MLIQLDRYAKQAAAQREIALVSLPSKRVEMAPAKYGQ